MANFPLPDNELERQAALQSYEILDTASEKDFDDIAELASAICETPISLIGFLDDKRAWFKSHKGILLQESDKAYSFCAHTIASDEDILIVEDARLDERFSTNPLVTGELQLIFYAGVPLINEDGFSLGTLCVFDHKQRVLTTVQTAALKVLARQVMDKLELRRKVAQLEVANRHIRMLNMQLTENEHQAVHLIANAPVGIGLLKGREFIIHSANTQMLELWGKPNSIIGLPLQIALPELIGQPFLDLLDEVYTSGVAFTGIETKATIERNGKAGDYYFNFVYHPVKNAAGKTTSIMVVANEVSEQVEARKKIEESRYQLDQMVMTAPMGMTILRSRDLIVEIANTPMLEIWGREREDIIGKKLLSVFPELLDQPFPKLMADIFDTRTSIAIPEISVDVGLLDGTFKTIIVDFSYHPLLDTHGNVEGIIATVKDITERKQDEQRKNDFIGIVSHELKTPLTSLKAYLQIMGKQAHNQQEAFYASIANKTLIQVEKMHTLIKGFLDVARLGSGKIYLDKKPLEINQLLRAIVEDNRFQTSEHIIVYTPCDDIMVLADSEKIAQVVNNFINNAIKYSPPGSTIEISCSSNDASLEVRVKDEGIGISREDQAKLFERFYRVRNEQTHVISGFGIGLYLCAEIIQRHNGEIGVESELGKGSEFWFRLPLGVGH